MRRVVLLSVGLALLAVVTAWWPARPDPAEPDALPSRTDETGAATGGRTTIATTDGGSPAGSRDARLAGRPGPAPPAAPDEGSLLVRGHVHLEGTRDPIEGARVYAVMLWGEKIGPGISRADGAFEIRGDPAALRPGARLVVLGGGWVDTETATGRLVGGDHRWTLLVKDDGRPIVADVEVVRAASLEGIVRLPDGRPAGGALVRPVVAGWREPGFQGPWRLVEPVTTDAEGRFAFDALPDGEEGRLRADLEGAPPAFSEPVAVRRGEQRSVALRFHEPRFVNVEVVRAADGTPVPWAKVEISSADTAVPGVTFESGTARLGPLGGDAVRVRVEAAGYLPWRTPEGDAWGRELTARGRGVYHGRVELVAAAVIAGRIVLPEGISAPDEWGVEICGFGDAGEDYWQSWAEVDADRGFRVEVPAGRSYGITVEMDHYEGKTIWGHVVAEAGDENVSLVAELTWDDCHVPEGTPHWELLVLGPNGEPVRAEVEIQAERDSPFETLYDRLRATDSDGRVRVPLDPKALPIWVYLSDVEEWTGPAPGAALVGPLGPEGGRRTVRLPEARTIEGRVLDADGRPAQGVQLWGMVPEPADLPPDGTNWFVSHDLTHTDGRGRFVLDGLGEGDYLVRVDANDAGAVPEETRVAAGTRDVEIRLLPAPSVELHVVDEAGEPVGRARIEIEQREGARGRGATYYLEERVVYTEASGRVRIGGLEAGGRFDLTLRPPERREDEFADLDLRGWTPTSERIVLPTARTVAGTVRTTAGRPVPHAKIGLWMRPERTRDWTRADEEGTFQLDRVPPGEVHLAAAYPGAPLAKQRPAHALAVEAGSGNPVVLELSSGRELIVRLEESEGTETRIYLLLLTRIDRPPAEGEPKSLSLDLRQGRACFFGLDTEATYRVWGVEDYGDLYVMAVVEPGRTDVSVTPREGGEIRGRILLPRPFTSAYVELRDRGVVIDGLVEGDGSFLIRGVPPGHWRVRADRSSRSGEIEAETVATIGESAELDLRAK